MQNMSPHLKILSQQDITVFEFPPEFNADERKRFFDLPKWALKLIESFKIPTNKVGFVLQLGYFKAINRFFVARKFHKQDIEFVSSRLQILPEKIYLEKYIEATFVRHQEIILENFGFQPFNEATKLILIKEALSLCTNQLKPRLMFLSLVDFLRAKKPQRYNKLHR